MPASLLDSQLQTLERPAADEGALELDIAQPPEALAWRAARTLSPQGPGDARPGPPQAREETGERPGVSLRES